MVYECSIARAGVDRLRDGGVGDDATVVVKKLSSDASETVAREFAMEAVAMERIDHANILRLVGTVMQGAP